MDFNIINIFISLVLCVNLIVCKESPVVDTTHGPIVGKILRTLIKNEEYFGYMGIPYAAPPVGELRFMVSHFSFKSRFSQLEDRFKIDFFILSIINSMRKTFK